MRTAGAGKDYLPLPYHGRIHWSEPKLHNLTGHPHHPLCLRDGRVFRLMGTAASPQE